MERRGTRNVLGGAITDGVGPPSQRLVLDCLRVRPHPTHLTLESSLAYVEQLKPRRTYLTHIAHDIKHARDSALLPDGVECGYDGLEISDE